MQAGELRKRLEIWKPGDTQATSGAMTRVFTLASTVWGEAEPLSGRELWQARQVVPTANYRFRIRYPAYRVTPNCRILIRQTSTTLASQITTGTTATLTAAIGPGEGMFYMACEHEVMRVTAGNGTTTLTVERAALETAQATHTAGTAITAVNVFELASVQNVHERGAWLEMIGTELVAQ